MDYRRVPDNGGRVTGRGSCAISGVTTSAETRLFPLDPLWVAEQKFPLSGDPARVLHLLGSQETTATLCGA